MAQVKKIDKTPWWIYLILAISILSSLVGLYGGYFNGTVFYSEFDESAWKNNLVMHLAGMWASKNLGIIIILIFAFIKKHNQALAYLFLFKFITDTIDILIINTLYREGAAGELLPNLISWLILGLTSLITYRFFNAKTL